MDGDEEPDRLRPLSVIEMVDSQIEDADSENARYIALGYGKDPYPDLCILQILLKSVGRDYKDRLDVFMEKERNIDLRYGDPVDRSYIMDSTEATERLKNTSVTFKSIGVSKIDEQSAYWQGRETESADLTGWGDE